MAAALNMSQKSHTDGACKITLSLPPSPPPLFFFSFCKIPKMQKAFCIASSIDSFIVQQQQQQQQQQFLSLTLCSLDFSLLSLSLSVNISLAAACSISLSIQTLLCLHVSVCLYVCRSCLSIYVCSKANKYMFPLSLYSGRFISLDVCGVLPSYSIHLL